MSIRSDVEYYFEKHPNEKIYLTELQGALSEYTTEQLRPAVYWLTRNRDGYEIIHQGQCWIYKPAPVASGTDPIFKVLGEGTNKTVLMDDKGNIWIAKKVDD